MALRLSLAAAIARATIHQGLRFGQARENDWRLRRDVGGAFAAMATPARCASRRRAGLMSKPITRHPAAARFFANAPPMMPSPTTPTVPLDFFAVAIPVSPDEICVDARSLGFLSGGRNAVEWALDAGRLFSPAVIAYRRRQKRTGRSHENRSCRSRCHGRQHRGTADRGRPRRHRVESLAGKRPSRWPQRARRLQPPRPTSPPSAKPSLRFSQMARQSTRSTTARPVCCRAM